MLSLLSAVNDDCLDHMKTNKTDKDEAQQSPVATPPPLPRASVTINRAEPVSQEVMEQIMRLMMERDKRDKSSQVSLASPSPVPGAAMGSTREVSEDPLTATDVRRESNTRDMKDKLIAVDIHDTREMWVLEDTKWEELCKVHEDCSEGGCICLVSNDIVIVSHDVTLLFSLSTKQWKKLSKMPTSRSWTSAVAVDDKLMVIGGEVDDKHSKVFEILHVKYNKWSSAASLPKPLRKPLIAVLACRVFLLPQNHDSSVVFSTKLCSYDPLSNTYTHRARLPNNIRSTLGACMVGVTDMLYLLGGEQGLSRQYNPHSDQWIQLVTPTARYYANLPFAHPGYCAVVRDNTILLCGGSKGMDERNIEEYNTVTQQWKVLDIHLPFLYYQSESYVFNASM